ncbi:HEAT repeat domain-containing protein [Candidatus Uabimicrobium amorphum]|uniref:HEAT repeat-containing PBS lyase n=1 Tax=Uabimicrobium amorphum TaxID=2596890 RepID=A0A5S9IN56_UABAM|nr:HEAT repeat domain-containing protein [Candidatus Uabimicrobium amorphum]BBM83625.1 HEAT repeat-containing PBS lyase [Candidatus Uabimicrobium amorphum]
MSEKLLKNFYKKVLQVLREDNQDKEAAYRLRQLLSSQTPNKDFAKVLAKLGLRDVKLLVDILRKDRSYESPSIDCSQVLSSYMEECLPVFQNYVAHVKNSGNASQNNLETIHNQLEIMQIIHSGVANDDILRIIYGLVKSYQIQPQAFKNVTIAMLNEIGNPVILALVFLLENDEDLPDLFAHLGSIAMPALFIALYYPDAEVRYNAVEVIKKINSSEGLRALAGARNDPCSRVRQKVIEALGDMQDHRSTQILIEALRDEDAGVRLTSVKALGKIRSLKALNALLSMLEDKDWEVRREAVESMALYGEKASGYLAKALENDSLVVKKIASRILSHVGNQEAVPALMKAIYDTDISVRERAVIALGRIQGENSIVTLMFAFEDEAPLVRFAAIQVLIEIGSRSTNHLLNKALKDPEPLIRERANIAIQEILSREEV